MEIMHVYAITNLINGKIYVGQHMTDNLKRYLRNDVTRAIRGDKRKPHLYAAIAKHGPENFSILSLVQVNDADKSFCKRQLDKLEQFFIRTFESNKKEIGYNIAAGGGGSFGYTKVVTLATRLRMAEASRGRLHSAETKAKMSVAASGVPKSAEHRKNLSASKLGKKLGPFTEEHKEKIKQALLGKKHSAERTEKVRQGNLRFQEAKRQERAAWPNSL